MLVIILVVLFVFLQYRLWIGTGSLTEVHHLQQRKDSIIKQNNKLEDRNQALAAEVIDLKQGRDAIEERARSELGMIKEGEIFYQIIEPQPQTEKTQAE